MSICLVIMPSVLHIASHNGSTAICNARHISSERQGECEPATPCQSRMPHHDPGVSDRDVYGLAFEMDTVDLGRI